MITIEEYYLTRPLKTAVFPTHFPKHSSISHYLWNSHKFSISKTA